MTKIRLKLKSILVQKIKTKSKMAAKNNTAWKEFAWKINNEILLEPQIISEYKDQALSDG